MSAPSHTSVYQPDGARVARARRYTGTALLRLLAGELSPSGGSVRVEGSLSYLRQDLTLEAGLPVDEVLGIASARRALAAIEQGEATEDRFAAVGDDWDVEERARATLDRLGLGHLDLDRRVGEVSGGEAVLLGLAAEFLRRPDVLLLDEPTTTWTWTPAAACTTRSPPGRGCW